MLPSLISRRRSSTKLSTKRQLLSFYTEPVLTILAWLPLDVMLDLSHGNISPIRKPRKAKGNTTLFGHGWSGTWQRDIIVFVVIKYSAVVWTGVCYTGFRIFDNNKFKVEIIVALFIALLLFIFFIVFV